MAYVVLTYSDHSRAFVKMGAKALLTAKALAWTAHHPKVTSLTKQQARKEYRYGEFDVIDADIDEEFDTP